MGLAGKERGAGQGGVGLCWPCYCWGWVWLVAALETVATREAAAVVEAVTVVATAAWV